MISLSYSIRGWKEFLIFWLQVASHVMLGIPKSEEAPPTPQHPLSAMGDACSRMDLTAIHQILVMTHYKDDEGTNEVILLTKTATAEASVSFTSLC